MKKSVCPNLWAEPKNKQQGFEGTQKDAATATMAYFWSLSSVYNLVYDNRKCLSTSQSNSGTKDMCVVNWKVSSVALSLHPQKNETLALILAYVKSDARFPMFWRCVFHDLAKCISIHNSLSLKKLQYPWSISQIIRFVLKRWHHRVAKGSIHASSVWAELVWHSDFEFGLRIELGFSCASKRDQSLAW